MAKKDIDKLKKEAFRANINIKKEGLVVLTWGNASAINRDLGFFAIKPSGVSYDLLTWEDMVVIDLDGKIVDSKLKPSSDTLTHLEIYKGFKLINGIVHTHSNWATIWSQSGKNIPALGTTHADHFYGEIPCIKPLNESRVESGYELETGKQIVNYFKRKKINPLHMPACLLSGHASFVWGENISDAFNNAIALESCANMAFHTLIINKNSKLRNYVLKKHFRRKHGKNAYYGQDN